MRMRFVLAIVLLAAAPCWAEDSVFVDGAFNGSWGASFPPFIPQVIGPINFSQIDDAAGIAKMDGLRGAGTAAEHCPPASEKREFYGGDYDYQKVGEFYACTNGTMLFGVYRDFNLSDSGSIRIVGTFPDANPPNWTGSFTNAANETGDMHGIYQGGGIDTPLARVGVQPELVSLSGAGYSNENGLAPESYVSAFGPNLATQEASDSNLPTALGGITVTITDSMGQQHAAGLSYVGPTQVNYFIPAGVAPGMATVEVRRDGEVIATEMILIAPISPGLFSADGSGTGVAAARFLLVNPDGTRLDGLIYDATVTAVPLDFGPQDADLYVSLYGTGMRNFTGEVTVTVDGVAVPFAGPVAQGEFAGLDQINLGPLPRSLAGRGEVDIVVTVDGTPANVVTVAF
jgi:uncharacterized protein (TIGR03437 family)